MEWNDQIIAFSVLNQAWKFRQEDDAVLPCWYLRTEHGTVVMGTPFDDVDTKTRQAMAVALAVKELDAKSVMFVSDTWMRTETPGESMGETVAEPGQLRRAKRVSEYVDAVEALVCQVWRCDRTGYSIMRKYRQKDDGMLKMLGEDIITEGAAVSGTFAAVLKALYANPCP